jgi:hypothetical protein
LKDGGKAPAAPVDGTPKEGAARLFMF